MSICIFTVIKNEQQYLDEWIKYHLDLGIDHLFIFEDNGSESHKEITDNYSSEKVSLNSVAILPIDKSYIRDWQESKQRIYNQEGLWWIKNNYNYDWCFAIDCDEYITLSNSGDTLQSVLSIYSDYDAVILQWQNYNANGHVYKPNYEEKGIIDTYTQKCGKSINDALCKSTKLMYRLNTFKKHYFLGTHLCYDFCKWCKTDYSKELNKICYDNIYLRHYLTKSWEEYVWKLKVRGMFHVKHRNYDEFFEMNQDMLDRKEELIKWADKYVKQNNDGQTSE
jgi:hypothetical protein